MAWAKRARGSMAGVGAAACPRPAGLLAAPARGLDTTTHRSDHERRVASARRSRVARSRAGPQPDSIGCGDCGMAPPLTGVAGRPLRSHRLERILATSLTASACSVAPRAGGVVLAGRADPALRCDVPSRAASIATTSMTAIAALAGIQALPGAYQAKDIDALARRGAPARPTAWRRAIKFTMMKPTPKGTRRPRRARFATR